jgi:hypothetical protein
MNPFGESARVLAHAVAPRLHRELLRCSTEVVVPEPAEIEELLRVAFWTSVRREESRFPTITLAFIERDSAQSAMTLAEPFELTPAALAKVSPAVERAGIHLGVCRIDGRLMVWGVTRRLSPGTFVLEVLQPALIVVKQSSEKGGKYDNVAVIEGDHVTFVRESAAARGGHSGIVELLGLHSVPVMTDPANVAIQLATSMRSHRRGGTLLIVPASSNEWMTSIVMPMLYEITPPYRDLAALLKQTPGATEELLWRERLRRSVDTVASVTAVDGAAIINTAHELLAFGVKLGRHGMPVREVMLVDVADEAGPVVAAASTLGGTRHLSAAQFVHDQPDTMALVASEAGRFTAFAKSTVDERVWAYRIEALLW